MSQIEDVLSMQIVAAESLLRRANAIPNGDTNTHMAGYIRYDERITRPLAKDIEAWQTETTEYLRVLYGEEARQVADFVHCINDKSHYFKFREGVQSELQDCISELNAFIKAEKVKQQKAMLPQTTPTADNKSPLVFISHSHNDIAFVEALVDLLEFLGLNQQTMFCSSVPGYGIQLSGRIIDNLLSVFEKHRLYVIFIQSPEYYKSPISLNEMGAAWVLRAGFCSFLTKDMDFNAMKGVIDKSFISIKVNSADAAPRLNQMKDDLVSMFGLAQPNQSRWETKRDNFLKIVGGESTSDQVKMVTSLEKERMRLEVEILKREEMEHKQARLRGNIVPTRSKGSRILKIVNSGNVTARNVSVEWLNPDDLVLVQSGFGTLGEITPQNERLFNIVLCEGHQNTMRLRYTWDDDYSEDNVFEEDVQL